MSEEPDRSHAKPDAPDGDDQADMHGVFRVWVDSDLKVQLLVFFHANPGVMETTQGLARRLGLNPELLEHEIQDHVQLGILTERDLGDKKIYVYNRHAEHSVAEQVKREIERRMTQGAT